MGFGAAPGTACLTFVIMNIDDMFILVTFYAEATTSQSSLTPCKITLGQYLGFTVILAVSMIGFALAVALPSAPIRFLGLLPTLLGIWKLIDALVTKDEENATSTTGSKMAGIRGIFEVSAITMMNGGDNIGTYASHRPREQKS